MGVFLFLFVLYTAVMYVLFYRQVFGTEQLYHSDMKAYILEMQGLNTKYSFPYPIFFKLGAFFHLFISSPEVSIAVAATVLNSLSVIFMKYYMNKTLQFKKLEWKMGITLAAFSLFFVSMLYFPGEFYLPGISYKYRGVFSPNPFHNATYMATRPFAIAAFFLFADILPKYEKETDWKEFIWFSLFLLLTTMTKPSFTLVLVSTAGVMMVWRLIRSRFKTFIPAVKLGICFIPTFCALLYQFFGVFETVSGEHGLGIGFAKVWSMYSGNIFFSVLLAAGGPLFILLFHLKELRKDGVYRFSWQLFLMSLIQVLFLLEKGFRMGDMNFSWGYMHGLFFIFVSSFWIMLKDSYEKQEKLWMRALQWLSLLAHLVMGIWYFRGILMGNMYY